jgi:integrase/recombinase XerC
MFVKDFIIYLKTEKRYSENTLRTYEKSLNNFLTFMQNHKSAEINKAILQNITVQDVHGYLSATVKNMSKSTANNHLSALKSFYHFLARRKGVKNAYVLSVKNIKNKPPAPKAVTQNEMKTVLEDAKNCLYGKTSTDNKTDGIYQYVIFMLLYGLGLRVSEVAALNYEDVQQQNLSIIGKGSKERILPLPDFIKKALQALPAGQKDDPLFLNSKGKRMSTSSIRHMVQKARLKLNLPSYFTPHAFRHSFATHLLEQGVDIRMVQTLLGHSSLSTTQRYLAVNQKDIITAHSENHPLERRKN